MSENTWKWKLNDKRTQDRYVDRGLIQKETVEKQMKSLPDLSASATVVQIDMEEGQMEEASHHFNSEDHA